MSAFSTKNGPVRNQPLQLLLFLLKLLGGFPYTYSKRHSLEDVMDAESGNGKLFKTLGSPPLRTSTIAFIWSGVLCVLVMSSSVWNMTQLEPKFYGTTGTLLVVIQVVLAFASFLLQPYFFLRRNKLARLIDSFRNVAEINVRFSEKRFFISYAVLGLDIVFGMYISSLYIYRLVNGIYIASTLHIIRSGLQILHTPLSSAITFSLIYTLSSTLVLELNERLSGLEICLNEDENENVHPLKSDKKMCSLRSFYLRWKPPKVSQKGKTLSSVINQQVTSLAFQRRSVKSSSIQQSVDFLLEADDIVKNLMEYEGFPLLVTLMEILTQMIIFSFRLLQKGINDMTLPRTLPMFVQTLVRLICVLCSPDAFHSMQKKWLRRLRRQCLRRGSNKVTEEIQPLIVALEGSAQFSVCGLFTLGRQCLIPVFSCVLSYLIIALQFYISEKMSS